MESARVVVAGILAFFAVGALLQLAWGYLHIPSLADAPPLASGGPRVSVIVAARDEERHIETAVASLLRQDYGDLELVVVDDRSTDRTPEILARLSATHPALRVVRVNALPPGWLGKNHALHTAAAGATGELLVFADADVVMAPDALSRAVRLFRTLRADHLAIGPDFALPTWPLALVVNYFMMWFMLYLRAWRVSDPKSSAFIGIGAFNMVSATAYRRVDGHTRIRLRPDDDLMLGKLLKISGFRQSIASASGLMSVEWYASLTEMAVGFRKNAFAGMNYSLVVAIGGVFANLALCVWPFVAVWLTHGAERALYAAAALAQMVAYAGPALVQRTRPWLALLYPFAALAFVAILTAAVSRTLRRGGIEWRGTSYPLDELRANRI